MACGRAASEGAEAAPRHAQKLHIHATRRQRRLANRKVIDFNNRSGMVARLTITNGLRIIRERKRINREMRRHVRGVEAKKND
jgi:hypothetical protein